ncbi:putative MFS family arabinose efflux permease [Tumebacillus sp. BK434]|uniref:MDR family MFS transporter n=1 Tax=Tumebacillus sp. BK434 TaxID=2512169 RepID=UPI0010D29388|nr:MFS transporter [Tumebacillus sp. BK434]TCP57588.1 putative MFS family arabinose efflux permease [Tumebacillus sp. BK434]
MFAALRAYPRIIWLMSFGVVVSSVGESFFWPLTTTYVHQALGQTLAMAGVVLLLQYTACLVGNLAGGMLFDRWSGRKTMILAVVASIVLLILMGSTTNFYLYMALQTLLGFCNGIYWPIQRAVALAVWPEGGRRAVNLIYVANNLGVAVGAASGGLLASLSFSYAFWGNALTYVCFLFLFMAVVKSHHLQQAQQPRKDTAADPVQAGPERVPVQVWVTLGMLVLGLTILVVAYIQWQTTIPAYIQLLGFSMPAYSFLWTVNGFVIVAMQPVLAWAIKRFALSLHAQIVIGALWFVLAMLLVTCSVSYGALVVGMMILTVGEMLVWPGVPSLASELAVRGREGLFQGIAMSGQSIGRMIGPLLGAFLYEQLAPGGLLLSMTALCGVAVLCFTLHKKTRRPKPNNFGLSA